MKYILSNTAAIAVFARVWELYQNIFAALICGVLFGILTAKAMETMPQKRKRPQSGNSCGHSNLCHTERKMSNITWSLYHKEGEMSNEKL